MGWHEFGYSFVTTSPCTACATRSAYGATDGATLGSSTPDCMTSY